MADIAEIPLDNADIAENITNIAEDITNIAEDDATIQDIEKDIPEDVAVEVPEKPIKAKAKGRPKGSANKGPPKPRAKKAQIQEAPVEDASEPYEAYEPASPKRNLRIPTDPTSSDVAAAMLKLLQNQTYSRQNRKQALYNSWFQ